jgi:hypothetical protein
VGSSVIFSPAYVSSPILHISSSSTSPLEQAEEIKSESKVVVGMEMEGDIQFMRWISIFNLLGDECFDGFIDFSH